MKVAVCIYGEDKPRKPSKLTPDVKELKTDIVNESKTVKMIGRFKSCKATGTVNMYDTRDWTASALMYEFMIDREKASEAVVFLAATLTEIGKETG